MPSKVDRWSSRRIREHPRDDIAAIRGPDLRDLDRDVGAPETVDETARTWNAELGGDVFLHQRRGGRGERDDRCRAEQWQALADKLKAEGIQFIIEPHIRFAGETGEQATMFLHDPSANALEFKAFADQKMIFARSSD